MNPAVVSRLKLALRLLWALVFVVQGNLVWGQTRWEVYASDVIFKIKNAGFTVTGRFGTVSTSLLFSPDMLSSSSLQGNVAVASLTTGIRKRDEHLMQAAYFDEPKFGKIAIASEELYKEGDHYAGLFRITVRDVSSRMKIPFYCKITGNEAVFTSDFTINRRDFGVGGSSFIMSDEVHVTISVKARHPG